MKCPRCDGFKTIKDPFPRYSSDDEIDCPLCGGTGKVESVKCAICGRSITNGDSIHHRMGKRCMQKLKNGTAGIQMNIKDYGV